MIPSDIQSSLQRLRTLGDIKSASKQMRDEDYFQLKRDYENLLQSTVALLGAVNDGEFSPQFGSGSPEGVVTANYSLFYVDTSTNRIYYNTTVGAQTGWTITA